ncbi:MAG: hypothetical protein A2Z03_02205 [Chloroflexi bacterium RBG_16_56_8]|nr:MAG: hypothetical protein A2Z03_02205 [Chloroflexi bacterium RBG_16_56_8]
MSNHPNRSKPVTPAQIVALRGGMTQTAAAKLWRVSLRTVQRWEAGEIRPSHIAWIGMREVVRSPIVELSTGERREEKP